jgi:hypothetical protein
MTVEILGDGMQENGEVELRSSSEALSEMFSGDYLKLWLSAVGGVNSIKLLSNFC